MTLIQWGLVSVIVSLMGASYAAFRDHFIPYLIAWYKWYRERP